MFLGGFTGGIGMSGLASGLSSLTSSGLSVVPFHGPRTEYHPSSSAQSGRLPSPAGKPRRLPSSSKPHSQLKVAGWCEVAGWGEVLG